MTDELAKEIDQISKEANELSLPIVIGSLDEEKLPVVEWEIGSTQTSSTYLALAKNLGCTFVVLERYEFDQEALNDLNPKPTEEENDEKPEEVQNADRPDLERRWEKLVNEHASYVGLLYAFDLYYIGDGICHKYDREASWYTKLAEAASALKEEMRATEAEMEVEIPDLTEVEIEETATQLAHDKLFQSATNQNARRFAFKKKFPQIADEHHAQTTEIIDNAKGIFELELKPELEKTLDTQIIDLAKDGLHKEQIAKKLRIPVSRVKKVL